MAGIEARVSHLEKNPAGNAARIEELEKLRRWILFGGENEVGFVDTRAIIPHWSSIKDDLKYVSKTRPSFAAVFVAIGSRVIRAVRKAAGAVKRRVLRQA